MPQKKLRFGGYPRVSDPGLKDSPTLDSQEKVIRDYIESQPNAELVEAYILPEAMSAYMKPYKERPELMKIIDAARHKLIDVLVVTEYSRLSRHQTEQAVIIYILEEYGVQVVSITEQFEDTPVGRFMRSVYAFVSELEREKIFIRTTRGRKDRMELGNLTGQGKPSYGLKFVDTEDYDKSRAVLDDKVIFTQDGVSWTEADVAGYMAQCILEGMSTRQLALTLTRMGVPTRRGKPWKNTTIDQILRSPFLKGEATANHYYRNGNKSGRRPEEEVIHLPEGTIPAILDPATWELVQDQLDRNKQNSNRNGKQKEEDIGLLRNGLAKCSICGRTMILNHREYKGHYIHDYYCHIYTGLHDKLNHHNINISMRILDEKAWLYAIPYIQNPCLVRQKVEAIRKAQRPTDTTGIEGKLAKVKREIANLFKLARISTDTEDLDNLAGMLQNLEKQKQELEAMLYVEEEEAEQNEKIEHELQKFEKWADDTRHLLDDPDYRPTYNEKRMAVQILGIKATIFPVSERPERIQLEVSPPKIESLIFQNI